MIEKKYIDREEIFKFPIRLNHYDKEHGNIHFIYGIESVMKFIENLPAANVIPVESGFWKPILESEMTGFNPKFAGRDPIAGYKCSNCGNEAIFNCNDEFVLSNYCPNCGTKMNGDNDNK